MAEVTTKIVVSADTFVGLMGGSVTRASALAGVKVKPSKRALWALELVDRHKGPVVTARRVGYVNTLRGARMVAKREGAEYIGPDPAQAVRIERGIGEGVRKLRAAVAPDVARSRKGGGNAHK